LTNNAGLFNIISGMQDLALHFAKGYLFFSFITSNL